MSKKNTLELQGTMATQIFWDVLALFKKIMLKVNSASKEFLLMVALSLISSPLPKGSLFSGEWETWETFHLVTIYHYQSRFSKVCSCFNNLYFTVVMLWLWNTISRFLEYAILKLGGICKVTHIFGEGCIILLGKNHTCMQLLKNEEDKRSLYPQEPRFKWDRYYNYKDIILN